MKKYFLILAMMLTAVSGAWADDSGSCGTAVTWSYNSDSKTLTISKTGEGSGAMTDYNFNNQPWKDLKSQITTVTIESGVTSIGDYAFDNCANLASVTIPATVTSIGDYAFSRCTNLTAITIPAGVESIGTAAFNGCINLTAFNVAEENTNYSSEDGVLFNKTKTTIVSYPAGKTATTYEIPTTVTSIGNGAFAGCTNLTSVNIPANVTAIGEAAFMSCSNLTSVTIPANVTAIGEAAFMGCSNLASVTVYAPACTLGPSAFDGCAYAFKIYVFNERVGYYQTAENWSAYAGKITGLNGGYCGTTGHVQDVMWLLTGTSPNYTLTIWGTGAMADYFGENSTNQPWYSLRNQITTVVIGGGVTTIGNNAFEFCSNLASVNIPASVTTIGDYAFFRCASLTAFNVDDGNANYSSDAIGVLFNKAKTTLIQYPAGNTATSYTIPASVTTIGNNAFEDCTNLATVSFEGASELTTIGMNAFGNCINLASINIPAKVTSIGENAFEGCTSLTAINVDDGNANYASEDGVLFNKAKTTLILYPFGKTATTYEIPTTVTSIGNGAFLSCTNLTSVTIPANVTAIGEAAFIGCTNLTSVTVYATTPPSLRPMAFFQNASNRKIYVPSASVETYKNATNWITYKDDILAIPAVASGNCGTEGHESDVTWEIIGTSPNYTLIISGTGAMAGYDPGEQPWKAYNGGITSVVIGNGVTNIGRNICYGYTTLTYVSIPASVTSIGARAFYGCSKLPSITLPASVTSIGDDAFYQCIELATLTLNSSPLIGDYAFDILKEGAVVAINAPAHDADSYQWATFYNENYAFQADANTQVFKVTLAGSTVTLLEVTDKIVNAGTPVVLKSTGTPVMTLTTASSSDTQGNDLVGTSATMTNPGNAYVLNNTAANGVGFYKLSSTGTIEFGKAYLVATAGAREFLGLEEATGIETINHSPLTINHDVYDIHGRRVNGKPSKGLYIINGKKVIIK